jgi:hypothetical protein
MSIVVYMKNCDCLKYTKNTPTCFGSRRIHHQGLKKKKKKKKVKQSRYRPGVAQRVPGS